MQNFNLMINLRNKANLEISELSRRLNIKETSYKLYELGKSPMPLKAMDAFCTYFNISIDYLLNLSSKTNYYGQKYQINYLLLKNNIILIRKKKHLRQVDMAEMFGISLNTYRDYENKLGKANSFFLYKFGKNFNVSIDYICGKIITPKNLD